MSEKRWKRCLEVLTPELSALLAAKAVKQGRRHVGIAALVDEPTLEVNARSAERTHGWTALTLVVSVGGAAA